MKMTGHDIYKRALALLGYINTDTQMPNGDIFLKRMPDVLDQICLDLKIHELKRLSDNIQASNTACEAVCYGVAMLLALIEGDGAKNEIFTKIYNAKRASALSRVEKIQDKLPTTNDGVD